MDRHYFAKVNVFLIFIYLFMFYLMHKVKHNKDMKKQINFPIHQTLRHKSPWLLKV